MWHFHGLMLTEGKVVQLIFFPLKQMNSISFYESEYVMKIFID